MASSTTTASTGDVPVAEDTDTATLQIADHPWPPRGYAESVPFGAIGSEDARAIGLVTAAPWENPDLACTSCKCDLSTWELMDVDWFAGSLAKPATFQSVPTDPKLAADMILLALMS
jgi:hypothetical protein